MFFPSLLKPKWYLSLNNMALMNRRWKCQISAYIFRSALVRHCQCHKKERRVPQGLTTLSVLISEYIATIPAKVVVIELSGELWYCSRGAFAKCRIHVLLTKSKHQPEISPPRRHILSRSTNKIRNLRLLAHTSLSLSVVFYDKQEILWVISILVRVGFTFSTL